MTTDQTMFQPRRCISSICASMTRVIATVSCSICKKEKRWAGVNEKSTPNTADFSRREVLPPGEFIKGASSEPYFLAEVLYLSPARAASPILLAAASGWASSPARARPAPIYSVPPRGRRRGARGALATLRSTGGHCGRKTMQPRLRMRKRGPWCCRCARCRRRWTRCGGGPCLSMEASTHRCLLLPEPTATTAAGCAGVKTWPGMENKDG